MLDIHNHMLPELDDGASDWGECIAMARLAVQDGIEEIICTPHWVPGCFENTRNLVLPALKRLRAALSEKQIPLKVYPGAELRLDFNLPQRISSRELLTLNDTGRYALIELPEEILPQNLEHFFWDLQKQNLTPVISHPERNHALLHCPERLYRWVEAGALVQITCASLAGHFGSRIQKFSALLLEHRLVHAIATDAHGLYLRAPKLSEGHRLVEEMVSPDSARLILYENPRCILQGEPIAAEKPLPIDTRFFSSLSRKIFSFFRQG